MPNMDLDKHALALGKLVGNFHSLEFLLRAFHFKDEVALGKISLTSTNLDGMNEGDVVDLNALTNYDSLRQLINRYNSHAKILSADLTIDRTLVSIRDAIAHGRVSGLSPSPPFKLLKFDKPQKNKVKVKFSVPMTIEWFNEQIICTREAMSKVEEAIRRLENGTL